MPDRSSGAPLRLDIQRTAPIPVVRRNCKVYLLWGGFNFVLATGSGGLDKFDGHRVPHWSIGVYPELFFQRRSDNKPSLSR
jgi:hypothetical protein